MPEGTTPVFTNLLNGQRVTVVDAIDDGSITTAKLASGAVTEPKLADGAVTTNKILNDAVTFAKIQSITADRLLGRDSTGSGDVEEIALSTALEFTGSQSIRLADTAVTPGSYANANLTVDQQGRLTAASTGGGISTIQSGSLSGTTVSITSIPDTYAYLVVQITGGSSDTNARTPRVQLSTDNGSSYDNTASNYQGDFWDGTTYATSTLASIVQAASIAAIASTFTLTATIFNYHAGPHKSIMFRYVDSVVFSRGRIFYIGSTDAINAIQFNWDGTGNFDAGTYAVYGVS